MKFFVPFVLLFSVGLCAQTQTENYIKTTQFLKPTYSGVYSRTGVFLTQKDKAETITYYDGLGRPKQTVAVGVTPSGKDLVSHIGYDGFGRQHRDYLPTPASGNSGEYRSDAEAQTLAYYNTPAFDNTANPYTERIYEASPLNRVLEVGAPGNAWKADPNSDADRTIKTDHDANGWDDLVRWFDVDFEAGNTQRPTLVDKGVYPAGQLYKTTTKDENWRNYTYSQDSNKTETYTNKQGQVVLKRAFSYNSWHDTYYVYDDYGNQTFVIPPEVQTYASVWQQGDYKYMSLSDYDGLFTTPINDGAGKYGAAYLGSWDKSVRLYYGAYNLSGHTPINGSHFDLSPLGVDLPAGGLSGWAYYTKLDGSYTRKPITGYLIGNRISISGLPEEPMKHFSFSLYRVVGELRNDKPLMADQLETMMYHYRYDHRNRLVERKIPGKDWEYIAYDTLDRPVLTADGVMRANSQALKTEYDVFGRVVKTGLVTGVSGSSHDAFKTHIDKPISTLYTENYYDRYTFNKQGLTLPTNAVTGTQTQGLQTGSRVAVLNSSNPEHVEGWITTLIGYDAKGRTIYEGTHNPATGVVAQSTHTLDFVGRTTKTTTTQTKNGETLTKVDDFAYDHAGRLIDHDLTLNGQKEDLTHNTYDELGQLAQKTLGGGLQTVDYNYNIRGWLRHINNPDMLGDDLFGFTLDYGNLYNGNIQNTYWATANDGIKRRYSYAYDGLNRLRYARYNAPGIRWGSYNTHYGYDRNGNIKYLYRAGSERIGIDYLMYAYNGNQLLSVTDLYRNSEGFTDGTNTDFDYLYDANGNMTGDKNKGITMQYNHLNLPTYIEKGSQGHFNYTYDALGNKLAKEVYTYGGYGAAIKRTFYEGIAIYTQKAAGGLGSYTDPIKLELVFTPEGYAMPVSTSSTGTSTSSTGTSASSTGTKDPELVEGAEVPFTFVYQYKDHLGNVRLTYADNDKNGSINPLTEIVSETNYYPFGLQHKGYNEQVNSSNLGENWKYNGKEEENEFDLGWTDYGARRLMKDLGRWTSVDALAEKYETMSPFAYVANTPTNAIDPDGRLIIYVNGLLFKQALGHKVLDRSGGRFVGHYRYPPPRNFFYNQEPSMFGQPVGDYWGSNNIGIRATINDHFDDNNNIFINATDNFKSQASDRFAQGQTSGLELIAKLQNGNIVLDKDETIKVVGHSQGAAFAAGLLTALADSEYASKVELGLYLSPHQPGDFTHPDGIPGAQFSTRSDWVSSKSGVLGKILNAFNGQSELSEIEGADFLFIRPNHDKGKGGHDVDTWNDMLKRISEFLNR